MVDSAELDLYLNRYQTSHHISLVFARLQTVTLVLSAMPFERHFSFSITSLGSSDIVKNWPQNLEWQSRIPLLLGTLKCFLGFF